MADDRKAAEPPVGPRGPLLVYPTEYPFKVIGLSGDDLPEHVRSMVLAAAPGVVMGAVESRGSSGGKYLSVTVNVTLQSEDQRRAIYAALAVDARVVQYL